MIKKIDFKNGSKNAYIDNDDSTFKNDYYPKIISLRCRL
jgi:hypothetical protein